MNNPPQNLHDPDVMHEEDFEEIPEREFNGIVREELEEGHGERNGEPPQPLPRGNPQQFLQRNQQEMPMEINEFAEQFNDEAEVRMENDDRRMVEVTTAIRRLSKVSEPQANHMVKPLMRRLSVKENTIKSREDEIMQMMIDKLNREREFAEFQATQDEQLQHQLHQQALQFQQQYQQNAENFGDNGMMEVEQRRLVERMDAYGVSTVSDFEQLVKNCEEMQEKLEAKMENLQVKEREIARERERKLEEQQLRVTAELKLRVVEAEKEKLQLELKYARASTNANTFTRRGESERKLTEKNRNIQITERTSLSMSSPPQAKPRSCQGKKTCQSSGEKEVARAYCLETEEILTGEESEIETEEFNEPPRYRRANGRKERETELSVMSRWCMEQNLPEPKKFTGEKGASEMKAFEKTFRMKFGRLPQEEQIALLETKFFTGKAAKVFRGIPESEKGSVKSVLEAMANRLKISGADEERRAITKWDHLTIQENQSWEDYFLEIDELAEIALRQMAPEEISKRKHAKLMEAVDDDPLMVSTLEQKILEIPPIQYYDICRMLAVRKEISDKERAKRKEKKQYDRGYQSEKKNGRLQNSSQNRQNTYNQSTFQPSSFQNPAQDSFQNSYQNPLHNVPQNSAQNYYPNQMQGSQNPQNSSSYSQNSSSFSQNSFQSVPMNYQRNPFQSSPMQNSYQNQQNMQNSNMNFPQYSQQRAQLQNFQLSAAQTEKDQKNNMNFQNPQYSQQRSQLQNFRLSAAQTEQDQRAPKWTKPTEFRCYKCQEEGHMARNCPKVQEPQKPAAPIEQKTAVVQAIVEREESPILSKSNVIGNSENRANIWSVEEKKGVERVKMLPENFKIAESDKKSTTFFSGEDEPRKKSKLEEDVPRIAAVSTRPENEQEEERKRNDVDQKAMDAVMCQGPPPISCTTSEDSHSANYKSMMNTLTWFKSLMQPYEPGIKETPQKQKDVACGGVFEKKTKRRIREEKRPRTDPPSQSLKFLDVDLDNQTGMETELCQSDEEMNWSDTNSAQFIMELRPRKDPPVHSLKNLNNVLSISPEIEKAWCNSLHDCNWSDTSPSRSKEEPRPRKDPPPMLHQQQCAQWMVRDTHQLPSISPRWIHHEIMFPRQQAAEAR